MMVTLYCSSNEKSGGGNSSYSPRNLPSSNKVNTPKSTRGRTSAAVLGNIQANLEGSMASIATDVTDALDSAGDGLLTEFIVADKALQHVKDMNLNDASSKTMAGKPVMNAMIKLTNEEANYLKENGGVERDTDSENGLEELADKFEEGKMMSFCYRENGEGAAKRVSVTFSMDESVTNPCMIGDKQSIHVETNIAKTYFSYVEKSPALMFPENPLSGGLPNFELPMDFGKKLSLSYLYKETDKNKRRVVATMKLGDETSKIDAQECSKGPNCLNIIAEAQGKKVVISATDEKGFVQFDEGSTKKTFTFGSDGDASLVGATDMALEAVFGDGGDFADLEAGFGEHDGRDTIDIDDADFDFDGASDFDLGELDLGNDVNLQIPDFTNSCNDDLELDNLGFDFDNLDVNESESSSEDQSCS